MTGAAARRRLDLDSKWSIHYKIRPLNPQSTRVFRTGKRQSLHGTRHRRPSDATVAGRPLIAAVSRFTTAPPAGNGGGRTQPAGGNRRLSPTRRIHTQPHRRRKLMRKIALLFAVSVLVAGLAGPAMADIKVGIMVPTTGSEATYGKDMENAVKMAVDELNAKGGVLGQKFTTVTADDGCDPADGHRRGQQADLRGRRRGGGRLLLRRHPADAEDLRRRRDPLRHHGGQLQQVQRHEPGQCLPGQRHRQLPGRHRRRRCSRSRASKSSPSSTRATATPRTSPA